MTENELCEVRNLNERILELTRKLSATRTAQLRVTPFLDGMPHVHSSSKRLETLAIQAADFEAELVRLRVSMSDAAAKLINSLQEIPLTAREYTVIILRYVACMRFRDIQFEMGISDARMWNLHREALKKICECPLEKQR